MAQVVRLLLRRSMPLPLPGWPGPGGGAEPEGRAPFWSADGGRHGGG
eukprot:CAMPEP_0202908374 /NCGR_PEP_ID=MMETSP1392-20130828/45809_1 /ASSEMBLY_ACC=CAM_ASM_000868 /TAXON_ID=225041 /ORGANISM="Chlamydomonas chlamydogama, Strain SAG 11-48b" /LENGTH=46 /DNA_ID= /DNA_START= /DNA_END= /DNA_ORIENTATION=